MRKNSIKNTRINGEVQKELSTITRPAPKGPRFFLLSFVVFYLSGFLCSGGVGGEEKEKKKKRKKKKKKKKKKNKKKKKKKKKKKPPKKKKLKKKKKNKNNKHGCRCVS